MRATHVASCGGGARHLLPSVLRICFSCLFPPASLTLFPFICSSFASPSQGSANGCSKGAGVGRDKPDVHLAIVDSKGHKKVPQFVKLFAEQSQLYSLRLLRSRRLP